MITEDYVSFEVAKLLKEKGFDEQCRDFYRQENGNWLHRNTYEYNYFNLQMPMWKDCYACPTHQMAMKWLREKGIYFSLVPFIENVGWPKDTWHINFYNSDGIIGGGFPVKGYEEAVEAAIKYCLENLI